MIFATVGTHQDGFPRMLRALETLPRELELVVQYGNGQAPTNAAVAEAFMPFEAMLANFAAADRVVTHAGVGSIVLAIRHGHVPVVVPRLKRNGEHVDDHQVELAERMAEREKVVVVWHEQDLAAALDRVPPRAGAATLPQTGLHRAVHAALHAPPASRPWSLRRVPASLRGRG